MTDIPNADEIKTCHDYRKMILESGHAVRRLFRKERIKSIIFVDKIMKDKDAEWRKA